jgi:hypothetical protein
MLSEDFKITTKIKSGHNLGGNPEWARLNIGGWNKAKLVGERFDRLLVIAEAGRTKHKSVLWTCLCDCGKTSEVSTNALRSENVRSCGCLMVEQRLKNVRLNHARIKTHGLGHGNYNKTYKTWCSMRDRALHYTAGGLYKELGITICKRWDSYEAFLEDMGERPEGKTLDRINPYGNYEPTNCRWATPKEQGRNRTNTVHIMVNGQKVVGTEFAEKYGLSKENIYSYLKVKTILDTLND